mgnify:CR=1 FL=1
MLYDDVKHFRFFYCDNGLFGITLRSGFVFDSVKYNRAVSKTIIAGHLVQKYDNVKYWDSKSEADVDFILYDNSRMISVKYIEDSKKRIRSLQIFEEKYSGTQKTAVGNMNFNIMGDVRIIPLYAVFCL